MTTPTIHSEVADFSAFLPFTKVAEDTDGTIRVHTIVNDESVDDQGEVLDYQGTKAALDEFMKWANVREMHQPSAVGTVETLTHDDLAKVSEAILHVVDPIAIAKVHAGVYKGTSVGGRKGPATLQKIGGQMVRRLTAPHIIELSLVDRPSRPTAVLTLLKRADGEEAPVAVQSPTPDPVTPEPVETPADDPLAKAADGVEAEAPADTTVRVNLELDGQPLHSEVVSVPAAPDPAPLAKSAADDVVDAHMVIERITRLIEAEADESAQVADLRAALEAMQRFTAAETAEVGTPEDVAEVIAEKPVEVIVVNDMYYAAVTGDLAKRALELRKAGGDPVEHPELDQLVTLALAAGARCGHELAKSAAVITAMPDDEVLAKVAGAAVAEATDALMAKVSAAIGTIARPDDLDAMKGEILGALGPMQEELAKIASQPSSGGPLRYAGELRRFADSGSALTPQLEAEVLAKLAAATTDPVVKEALGRQAATAQIKAQQA